MGSQLVRNRAIGIGGRRQGAIGFAAICGFWYNRDRLKEKEF